MNIYDVVVRNELTGETVTIAVDGSVPHDAQTRALIQLFRTRGWRKCSAAPPLPSESNAPVAESKSA